jgi:hypothetical protein
MSQGETLVSDSRTQYEAKDSDDDDATWSLIRKASRAQNGSGEWKVQWMASEYGPSHGVPDDHIRVKGEGGGKGGGDLMDKELRERVDNYASQLGNSKAQLIGYTWDRIVGCEVAKEKFRESVVRYRDPGQVGSKFAPHTFLLFG